MGAGPLCVNLQKHKAVITYKLESVINMQSLKAKKGTLTFGNRWALKPLGVEAVGVARELGGELARVTRNGINGNHDLRDLKVLTTQTVLNKNIERPPRPESSQAREYQSALK